MTKIFVFIRELNKNRFGFRSRYPTSHVKLSYVHTSASKMTFALERMSIGFEKLSIESSLAASMLAFKMICSSYVSRACDLSDDDGAFATVDIG